MFRRLLLFIFLLLNQEFLIASVGPPQPTCIAVVAGGAIQLSWTIPADPGVEFTAYRIFRSSAAAGPFSSIGTLNTYTQNTFVDGSVNGNASSYFYYLVTDFSSGTSVSSDTIQSMKITVIPLGGMVSLKWNAPHAPLFQTSIPEYHVYQRGILTPWKPVDTVSRQSDTLEIFRQCVNDSLFFKVELRDQSGCSSWSSYSGNVFRDQIYPSVFFFDSVSVDGTTNTPVMGWKPNMTRDVRGYIIYRCDPFEPGSNTVILDTVYGQMNTFFAHPGGNASLGPLAYKISAFDSCYNTTPWTSFQQSIHLTATVNRCLGGVELKWTRYLNWPGGVGKYQVYGGKQGTTPVLIATVSGSDTSYIDTNIEHGETFCYFIRSWITGDTRTSTSNITCTFINTPEPPEFTYLKETKVQSASSVEVTWHVDPQSDVYYYRVERAVADGPFEEKSIIQPAATSVIKFVDDSTETTREYYRYRLVAIDTCGNEMLESNIGTTILLKAKAKPDLNNLLTWNKYFQYGAPSLTYELFRSVNGTEEGVPFMTVSDTTSSFNDDVYDFSEANGDFCYYIEAVEGSGNPYGLQGRSRSETVCVKQLPKMFIPNAFTPNGDGINDEFNPVNVFVDVSDYVMIIYNRRGIDIFETRDPLKGWDGTYKGETLPTGVYAYYIYLRSGEAEPFEKRGSITVLP